MTLLFLVATAGWTFQLHYCGGELMSLSVNGVTFATEAANSMPDCCNDSGCAHCRTVKVERAAVGAFQQGQGVHFFVQPFADLLQGGAPLLALSLQWNVMLAEGVVQHVQWDDRAIPIGVLYKRCEPVRGPTVA